MGIGLAYFILGVGKPRQRIDKIFYYEYIDLNIDCVILQCYVNSVYKTEKLADNLSPYL